MAENQILIDMRQMIAMERTAFIAYTDVAMAEIRIQRDAIALAIGEVSNAEARVALADYARERIGA